MPLPPKVMAPRLSLETRSPVLPRVLYCIFVLPITSLVCGLRRCCEVPRHQDVAKSNPAKKVGADTVRSCVDYLRSILRRIDVHPERSLAKRSIDHLDDRVRDRRDLRIGRDAVSDG